MKLIIKAAAVLAFAFSLTGCDSLEMGGSDLHWDKAASAYLNANVAAPREVDSKLHFEINKKKNGISVVRLHVDGKEVFSRSCLPERSAICDQVVVTGHTVIRWTKGSGYEVGYARRKHMPISEEIAKVSALATFSFSREAFLQKYL